MIAMVRYTARPDDWIRTGGGGAAYTTLVVWLMWPKPLRRMKRLGRVFLVLLAEAPMFIFVALVWRGTLVVPKTPSPFIAVGIIAGAIVTLGLSRRR